MSVRARNAVWSSSKLRHAARELLLAIGDRAHDDGTAWPGRHELIDRLRVTDRHVRRCIDAAIEAGELEQRTARDGRTVFRLRLPGLLPVDVARLAAHRLVLAEPFSESDIEVRTLPKRRTPRSAQADAQVRATRARSLPEKNVKGTSETVSDGNAPDGATAQELVAFYVDESRRKGADPLKPVVGQIARGVKSALDEGCTDDEIRAGLKVVISKGLHPSALASCIKKRPTKGASRGAGAFAEYNLGA